MRFAVGYELTAKTAFSAALGTSHRRLEQTLNAAGQSIVTAAGSDDTNTLSVGARWAPLRNVQLGCDLAREQRNASGGLTQDYRADTVGCNGRLTLQ